MVWGLSGYHFHHSGSLSLVDGEVDDHPSFSVSLEWPQ